MSSHGMSWARQQKTGNPTAKAVLLLLGELVNDEGETTRGQRYIADTLEIHVDTAGRALAKLETLQLVKRERRQASDTRRLHDRIVLMMQRTFEVTNQDPDTEPEPKSDRRDDAAPEPRTESDREPDGDSAIEPDAESGIKDNHSLNPLITSSGVGASAEPGQELDLGIAPKAVSVLGPASDIATKISTWTKKAATYHAIRSVAQWALEQYPDKTPDQIGKVMVDLINTNRGVNKINIYNYFEGIITPSGHRPKPSTTNERVAAPLSRAAEYERTGRT